MNLDWIPVKDRLPEIDRHVGSSELVLVSDGRTTTLGRLWAGRVLPAPYPASDPRWTTLYHSPQMTLFLLDGIAVDRWMPLPDPRGAPEGGPAAFPPQGRLPIPSTGREECRRLADIPVPMGKTREVFEVRLVLDVAEDFLADPHHLDWLAAGLLGLLTRSEASDDPWLTRDVVVHPAQARDGEPLCGAAGEAQAG